MAGGPDGAGCGAAAGGDDVLRHTAGAGLDCGGGGLMASPPVLGPVAFAGYEVPERITLGGRQRLAVHTLPGGRRVVDAMGPDDKTLAWSGVISGPHAAERVRQLDRLRRAGLALPLGWDGWRFTVVIASFEADSANPWWVPYRIECAVLSEGDLPVLEALPALATLAEAVGLGFGPDIDVRLAAAGAGLAGGGLLEVAGAARDTAALALGRALGLGLSLGEGA